MSPAEAGEIVALYGTWPLVLVDLPLILVASRFGRRDPPGGGRERQDVPCSAPNPGADEALPRGAPYRPRDHAEPDADALDRDRTDLLGLRLGVGGESGLGRRQEHLAVVTPLAGASRRAPSPPHGARFALSYQMCARRTV